VFWVISVYFNIRNTLPRSGTFLLGHPVCVTMHGSENVKFRGVLIICLSKWLWKYTARVFHVVFCLWTDVLSSTDDILRFIFQNFCGSPTLLSLSSYQFCKDGVKPFYFVSNFFIKKKLGFKFWSERENQQDAKVRCLFSTISQHVSGIIMPIFRRTRRMLLHVVCCAGSGGCGR